MGKPGGGASLSSTLLKRVLPSCEQKVLLVDFAVYNPDESSLVSSLDQTTWAYRCGFFKPETVNFMIREHEGKGNGMGTRTPLSPGIRALPADLSYDACLEESHMVMFDVAEKAMAAAGVKPREVDIVVTVSGFSALPSLSSAVASHFSMRSDVECFSLSGHGCPGGLVGVGLTQQLLLAKTKGGRLALLVINENTTTGFYRGNEEVFLPSNVLFRMGGAACIMSTRSKDKARAKYQLEHVMRILYTDNKAHSCIGYRNDSEGHKGVYIDQEVLKNAAAKAITGNLRRLGPSVLPWSEMMKVARNPRYKPDFSKAFQHIAVHPGARVIIDRVAGAMRFGDKARQPSIDTLERYGNTSASSTFYIMAYIERNTGLKRGDKVLQVSMGTGFKCISTVWRARRRISTQHEAWAPATQPYGRYASGWLRPRALARAVELETAEKGADAETTKALAALLASLKLDADGNEVQTGPCGNPGNHRSPKGSSVGSSTGGSMPPTPEKPSPNASPLAKLASVELASHQLEAAIPPLDLEGADVPKGAAVP
ncbi:hypothetical protein WJX81_000874 [Elliptochloris bilobata]|uniref:very-long-chain 3-oxoacyl-CoA synthase n=1 Tax=Elliptochloris bilobata TaxID=381761 RepID=A0AAW1R1Z5_9CHLO